MRELPLTPIRIPCDYADAVLATEQFDKPDSEYYPWAYALLKNWIDGDYYSKQKAMENILFCAHH